MPVTPRIELTPTPNYWPGSGPGQPRYGREIRTVGWHSTRGGRDHSLATELSATRNWFENPVSEAATHAIAGTDVVVHLYPHPARYADNPHPTGPTEWQTYAYWHAGIGAKGVALTSLGLEFLQRFLDETYDDDVIENGIWQTAEWCREFDIPPVLLADPYPTHAITLPDDAEGIWLHSQVKEGKSDPGYIFPTLEAIADIKELVEPTFAGATLTEKRVREIVRDELTSSTLRVKLGPLHVV
jgi:hypothetical protein